MTTELWYLHWDKWMKLSPKLQKGVRHYCVQSMGSRRHQTLCYHSQVMCLGKLFVTVKHVHTTFIIRSTPVESLHTILLGPYKYLLQSTIPKLSPRQKEEVLARIRAFDCSGFRVKMLGNVIRHHQSFVGRDYKGWAQMALFIIYPYLTEGDKKVWLYLTKVGLF